MINSSKKYEKAAHDNVLQSVFWQKLQIHAGFADKQVRMMEPDDFGFEKLEVWVRARTFKQEICKLACTFPVAEKFSLCDQIKRSARSITANISEGHGRYHYLDQIRFCLMARGSLSETINHLLDAFDENYISEAHVKDLKAKGKEIERLLNGYIRFLRTKRTPVK